MVKETQKDLGGQGIYSLYRKAVSRAGEALPADKFKALWEGLGDNDRAYWLEQFRSGRANLTAEVVEKFERMLDMLQQGVPETQVDSRVVNEVRERDRKLGFRR